MGAHNGFDMFTLQRLKFSKEQKSPFHMFLEDNMLPLSSKSKQEKTLTSRDVKLIIIQSGAEYVNYSQDQN